MKPEASGTTRRTVLAQGGGMTALLALLASGGLMPVHAESADQQELLFDATSMEDAIRALGGIPAVGTQITLSLPEAVEDGSLVPVIVESQLIGISEIYLLVEANPNPVAARFTIPPGTDAYISTRIKIAETCRVFAVVRSAAGLHAVSRSSQVTVGGCG